jgi:hypothetical protein
MSAVVSPVAGTRTEPKDSYVFIVNTTATFKIIFTSDGVPTTVDSATVPVLNVLQPRFLAADSPIPITVTTLNGSLVPGQQFEYQFQWNIPIGTTPIDEWIASYSATIGGLFNVYGDEFFTIVAGPGQIDVKTPAYATVDDVRKKKFNIDDYLPLVTRTDLLTRNNLIDSHLQDAADKLREELNLNKQRGFSANYRLFCTYYAIWSILLAARGEDGSSVSDQNILFWKTEWQNILAQEKRKSVAQGVPLGRG